jgi:hypothetical protein
MASTAVTRLDRPGQVVLGDQDNLLIDAKMVDRTSGTGR